MRNFSGLLIFVATLLMMPIGQAENLMDIYQKALLSDPGIKEAAANRNATLESRPAARGFLLPQIDANATFNDDSSDGTRNSTFGGANTVQVFEQDQDGWRWDIQLRQTLFRWDQWVTLKKASKQVA
jgi:outer membrane protein